MGPKSGMMVPTTVQPGPEGGRPAKVRCSNRCSNRAASHQSATCLHAQVSHIADEAGRRTHGSRGTYKRGGCPPSPFTSTHGFPHGIPATTPRVHRNQRATVPCHRPSSCGMAKVFEAC